MKIRFLGTNGWYDTGTGNTVCVLVETKDSYLVFDAGNGFYRLDRYIKPDKPLHLFLSHYHLDHVIGLHILLKFNFKQGLNVYGPPGLKELFNKVINKPYSAALSSLPYNLRIYEIKKGTILPAGIFYAPLKHSIPCYGYRVCLENKIIAYCTDTGFCENLIWLAKDADLLISECSFKPGQNNPSWPHLNPETAAKAAKESRAKKLALIHFDAALYLTHRQRQAAVLEAGKTFKPVLAARDNLEIKI